MRDPIRLTRLFAEAPESIRVRILRDAGVPDDRPALLGGEEGRFEEALQWIRRNLARITGPLLRYADFDDDTVAYLASEGSITVPEAASAAAVFRFQFGARSGSAEPDGTWNLAELAASAALLQELVTALQKANAPFAADATLPRIRVQMNGAVSYELQGGVVTVGAALAIQTATGVIPAVLAESSAGTVLRTLDRRASVRAPADPAEYRSANPFQRKPASALVERDVVLAACRALDVSEAYANHLLNRVLPVAVRLSAAGVRVEPRG